MHRFGTSELNKHSQSGSTLFTILGIIAMLTLIAATIWITTGRARFADICPDYAAIEYAYVTGLDGKGMDSAAVEMRDDVDFNMLYRTFTDSTGRFELFNDVNSFMLSKIPTRFRIYVHLGGYGDTVCYVFERHRVCHFRRISGPDTIRLDTLSQRTVSTLSLINRHQVRAVDRFAYRPWEETALRYPVADGINEPLAGWRAVRYGVLRIGNDRMPLACMYGPVPSGVKGGMFGTEGAYYVMDRNGDGDLVDDIVKPWRLWNDSTGGREADCGVRMCATLDTVRGHGREYQIEMQLQNLLGSSPSFRYRRTDALAAEIDVCARRYSVLLWDYGMSEYADLSRVVLAIDRNADGVIDTREGSAELLERIVRPFAFDSVALTIGNVSPEGDIRYREVLVRGDRHSDASVGTWMRDFTARRLQPVTLYREIMGNRFVLLYFFEGRSDVTMNDVQIRAILSMMRKKLGPVRLIGINRGTIGNKTCEDPVIEENQGWSGPLASRFHNHEARELICLDSNATVVVRGVPGRAFVGELWRALGRKDETVVMGEFDAFSVRDPVVGSVER